MPKSDDQSNLFEAGLAALLILGLVAGTSAHSQMADPVISAEVKEEAPLISNKRLEQIQSIIDRIPLHTKVLSWDEFDEPLGAGAKWERRLEPSYRKGFMTLIDDFEIKAGYDHGKLDETLEKDTEVGIGPGGLVRWVFARQVEGTKLSDNLNNFVAGGVYSPLTHQPTSAERAMAKMKPGDFIIMQANLNVIAGGSQLLMTNPTLPIKADGFYLISGEFQLHINRAANDNFGMKMIAVRTRELGAGISFGYSPRDTLKITEVKFIGSTLKRRLEFKPIEIRGSKATTNLFMVDYKFNFAKEEARAVYNDLMKSVWTVKSVVLNNLQIMNPFSRRAKIQDMLLVEVAGLEALYQKEKNKAEGDRAIDRAFMGSNNAVSKPMFIRLGHRDIAQIAIGNAYADNYVTINDKYDRARYFYLPVVTKLSEFRAGLGFISEVAHGTGTLLFETDAKQEITSFGELSFALEYRDKKFDRDEIRGMKDFLRKRVPSELYDRIEWGAWADERSRTNARVTSLLVFKPGALMLAENLAYTDLRQAMIAYVKTLPKIESEPEDSNSDGWNRNATKFEDKFHHDLNKIHENLVVVFNRDEPAKKRSNAFVNLRSNPLFGEIGPGFLVHVLKDEAKKNEKGAEKGIEELLKHIYFESQWTAKNSDGLSITFGPCNNRSLYKAVMYIYSVLNNRSLDLRLIDDENYPELPDKGKAAQCGDE